jgi:hypothetical protein
MKETFDSVYPDFLRNGLGKLNQLDARQELIALFAALEHFRRDLHSQDATEGILAVAQRYVGGLNLFRVTGFWLVNPADLNFEFTQLPGGEVSEPLKWAVESQIKSGRFGLALRQSSPMFFIAGDPEMPERGVMHSLSLSNQVMGMFCGLLQHEVAPAQEVAFSLLTLLLGESADAMATLRRTKQLTRQVEDLSNLLPLCAWCKKVRNDDGYWEQIEKYIMAHSSREITHGVCPECRNKILAEIRVR